MNSSGIPIVIADQDISVEDRARADFYGVLARLYGAAPDATLLRDIAAAPEISVEGDGGLPLRDAWHGLQQASASARAQEVDAEYQNLFIGVGKSEVSLYASGYARAASFNPLAELRDLLREMGLTRQPGVSIYEDHLAALLETMRLLIMGAGDGRPFAIAVQHDFFENHVQPWVFDCCEAIKQSPVAKYYRNVAELTEILMAIERDSLAME